MSGDPRAVATTYFEAWLGHDFDTLRSLLADEVTFTGPMGTADGMEECLKGLRMMSESMSDIVIRKMFVDGPDVITWYDLHTDQAGPIPTVNWSHLEGGQITIIRAVFDPRPLSAA